MTGTPEAQGRPQRLLPVLAALLALVVVAQALTIQTLNGVDDRLAEVEERLGEQARALDLMRVEAGAEGLGIEAVIDHVEFWVPQITNSGASVVLRAEYEQKLEAALRATEALGPGVFPTIENRIASSENDQVRRWLMKVALRSDRDRALQLIANYVSGKTGTSPRLRQFAADELRTADKSLAARTLRRVLETESHRGTSRPGPGTTGIEEIRPRIADFYNLISKYVAAEEDQERAGLTLVSLLTRPEHDLQTKQKCVEYLGRLGTRKAAPVIKRLFADPPTRDTPMIFRQHCVRAIGQIEKGDACDWFRAQLTTNINELVRKVIRLQLTEYCGG